MKIRDIMTTNVLTIGPEAPLRDVAGILVANRISGLPVCDAERHVIGVVSEADILYQEHDPLERHAAGPLAWLVDGGPTLDAVVKAKARTAREAMTTPPLTIGPLRSVADAARLMSEHGVNRLPVVQGEKLVGIVTRADLVRAYARPDAEIEEELYDDVIERTLWLDRNQVEVHVKRGAVTLAGTLHTRGDAELLERRAARVPGVVSVHSTLAWELDEAPTRARGAVVRTIPER